MDLSRLAVIEVDNKVNISVLHSIVRIERFELLSATN